jgi:hypothetical protein
VSGKKIVSNFPFVYLYRQQQQQQQQRQCHKVMDVIKYEEEVRWREFGNIFKEKICE